MNDGLWDVPLPQAPPKSSPPTSNKHSLNVIINKSTSKKDIAQYLHACAFSPCTRTFLTAIRKGHFLSWPGLTPALITKHLPPSVFTAKGHMNQEMKNLQSTSRSYKDALLSSKDTNTSLAPQSVTIDYHPAQDINTPKTHNCFITICQPSKNEKPGFWI